MTKKHFQALAKAVKDRVDNISNESKAASLVYLANDIADVCKRENDRFDRAKFLEACGL